MTNLATLALCFAAAIGGGDGGGNEIEVRIRTGALVRGTDVTIGELCEITPINRETLELMQLTFSRTPASGHARTVTRTEIVQALAAAGRDVGKFDFAGPTEIVIQPVRTGVPVEDLLESASAALQALIAVEGGDVEVESPVQMRRIEAPPGRQFRTLIARVRSGRTGTNSAVVDVDIMVDGVRFRSVPVQFKLQRFQMLLKTVGVIRKDSPLGAHNLKLTREPLAEATGLYLTRLDAVIDMVAARNLQSNSRITIGDIAPPALIKKGEIVTVVLTKGRIKVTAKAMANHDAPLTGRVTLTNLRSRGSMTGIVAGPGLVVIQN